MSARSPSAPDLSSWLRSRTEADWAGELERLTRSTRPADRAVAVVLLLTVLDAVEDQAADLGRVPDRAPYEALAALHRERGEPGSAEACLRRWNRARQPRGPGDQQPACGSGSDPGRGQARAAIRPVRSPAGTDPNTRESIDAPRESPIRNTLPGGTR